MRTLATLAIVVVAACGGEAGLDPDGGAPDGGAPDGGTPDGGTPGGHDASPSAPDAPTGDAGQADGGGGCAVAGHASAGPDLVALGAFAVMVSSGRRRAHRRLVRP